METDPTDFGEHGAPRLAKTLARLTLSQMLNDIERTARAIADGNEETISRGATFMAVRLLKGVRDSAQNLITLLELSMGE